MSKYEWHKLFLLKVYYNKYIYYIEACSRIVCACVWRVFTVHFLTTETSGILMRPLTDCFLEKSNVTQLQIMHIVVIKPIQNTAIILSMLCYGQTHWPLTHIPHNAALQRNYNSWICYVHMAVRLRFLYLIILFSGQFLLAILNSEITCAASLQLSIIAY